MKIPLFPLHTVLYPGGPLPLRIFEPRYLDMISACLKNDSPFGVVLIKDGSETGDARTYDVGTLAHIDDWYQGSDGLLGITAIGEQRFRLQQSMRQNDGLIIGEVELLATDAPQEMPEEFRPLAQILAGVLDDLGKLYESLEKNYEDAGWVAYRFAEILPISPQQKQSCLETDDPMQRLRKMRKVLKTVRGSDNE
jgi:Lon protease-like protein